jgi:(4-(4-[2-(gamma-L-glutamylamino)ethyl]phenoxymethyl)furan-2-yl)methanamine synthase
MTSPSVVVGWDVGGAHLKAARLGADGRIDSVVEVACPLWLGLSHLETALGSAKNVVGEATLHAITMTAEMVDLFPSREEGVRQLIEALRRGLPGASLRFFAGSDGFLDASAAARAGVRVASANWLAAAAVVARGSGSALLVDVGTTTTDLIPVTVGRVAAEGVHDAGRLVAGELVYTGVVRTAVMALAPRAPFDGEWVPLMAEHFANLADVYRLTGQLPPGADLHPAPDGGPKTLVASARRLARMVGRDLDSAPMEAWQGLAGWLAREQARQIGDACDRLLSRPGIPRDAPLVGAGVGRFLLPGIATARGRSYREFAALVPTVPGSEASVSDCAPAVAVALLAAATRAV